MVSAGRVLIKPCGDWDDKTTYRMLDLVNHNGCAYLAKRTVVGIEPSAEHTEYWHLLFDIRKVVAEEISKCLKETI